jgi:hypothetical protein
MTDLVERLNHWASCTQPGGEPRELLQAAIAEITKLRSQLSLQKEKLPEPKPRSRSLGAWIPSEPDWRDYPEAP